MKNLRNSVLTVTMAIGLAITGLSPAHASTTSTPTLKAVDAVQETQAAPAVAVLKFERPSVTTAPAEPVDAPVEIVQPQSSESVSTVATTPVAQTVPPVVAPAPAPAPAPKPAPPVAVSGNAVAAAALAQIGVRQDCTALVTNSLAAVGIHFHGWPADYMSLGHIVPASAAQPGDLAYYANGGTGLAHIAVYIGNGQAVHGGWNGSTTAIASVNIGSGPVFIHI